PAHTGPRRSSCTRMRTCAADHGTESFRYRTFVGPFQNFLPLSGGDPSLPPSAERYATRQLPPGTSAVPTRVEGLPGRTAPYPPSTSPGRQSVPPRTASPTTSGRRFLQSASPLSVLPTRAAAAGRTSG